MPSRLNRLIATAVALLAANAFAGKTAERPAIEKVVNTTIHSVMAENDVPGMAVAITFGGKRQFFQYGVASKETGTKVTKNTLFEIGSVSKVFTATLVAYAHARGNLSLADSAGRYLDELSGSSFDAISLLELCTFTAGGLPLQFPASVTNSATMISYFKAWRPEFPPGSRRLYSNPSIGLCGHLAAKSIGQPFDTLMEKTVFPAFGLRNTYLRIPNERMNDYAWGYAGDGKAIRVSPGVLDSEAYGVKTSAADLIRFAEAQIDSKALDKDFSEAVAATQSAYFDTGDMRQGLGWEMYTYPTSLRRLLDGNSPRMTYEAAPVTRLVAPRTSRQDMLFNKTGSTNGFGAYVAFIPARRIGIVMLANKNYPVAARVKAAHRILAELDRAIVSEESR
ncbi:beta-lactamase class C [Paucimonas lemoignei]|uniref:Beta-lactamase n=1 Tax=Paucimonas lemoignei TaxID=29443 RepID=A0A4R3I5R7_PAULE|nr:class C beta-lactamase [Paucimonas lemoignei]TCS39349.1 beta-lactamase class C [Paucimonas lemoignei]